MKFKTLKDTILYIAESQSQEILTEEQVLTEERLNFAADICEETELNPRDLIEMLLDLITEKKESAEEREQRRWRDDDKYDSVRQAAGIRHHDKINAEYKELAAKNAAIQKKIDIRHKAGERAGTKNPHRDREAQLGGIMGVVRGDEGMRRAGVQSLPTNISSRVAKSNQKRRDALP